MFSEEFKIEFKISNNRLKQPLIIEQLEIATRYLASKGINTCLSIQPGHSGYAWSERKVVMVFLWNNGEKIRIRYIKRNSIRNSEIGLGCFKELKGFPRGNVIEKINNWSNEVDGIWIEIQGIKKIKKLSDDFYSENSETAGLVFYREFQI